MQIKWLRLSDYALRSARMPALDAPLAASRRTGGCFGTPTAASPGWSARCWLGPDRSRLRAAGESTRCRRTYSDSRTGRRSPTRRWWVRSVALRRWA